MHTSCSVHSCDIMNWIFQNDVSKYLKLNQQIQQDSQSSDSTSTTALTVDESTSKISEQIEEPPAKKWNPFLMVW